MYLLVSFFCFLDQHVCFFYYSSFQPALQNKYKEATSSALESKRFYLPKSTVSTPVPPFCTPIPPPASSIPSPCPPPATPIQPVSSAYDQDYEDISTILQRLQESEHHFLLPAVNTSCKCPSPESASAECKTSAQDMSETVVISSSDDDSESDSDEESESVCHVIHSFISSICVSQQLLIAEYNRFFFLICVLSI